MFEDLTKAIETIERQYKIGIDYGSQKDMTAVCLLGEQAEVVIKALAEYMEHAKAKADGRLVVLPCGVGEKVYRYCNDAINEGTIINILLNVKTGEIGLEYEMPTCYTCSRSGTLGKNLFLTREAAEKAIGGKEDV